MFDSFGVLIKMKKYFLTQIRNLVHVTKIL